MRQRIAVIGLSGLFPGAETPEQFWQNLINEKDVTSQVTAQEFGVDPGVFYDPAKGKLDKSYCLRGGFIRDFQFNPKGFNILPEFLESLDDLFKWSLYVSRLALQDSGYLNKKTTLEKCGIIFGNLSFPTRSSRRLFAPLYTRMVGSALQELLRNQDFTLEPLSSARKLSPLNMTTSCLPAAVISQALALGGPQFSLDAACASSLYAIKLACDYLQSGKADLMLAGAVSCADPLYIHIGFSIFQAYPEEREKHAPLDKSSAGLISSEGAGALVLKRYKEAVKDGDHIYATICGAGLSNDGRGKFLLVPNPKGQLLALERAYGNTDVKPEDIQYLECHATGTPVGDAAELSTIDTFFGQYKSSPLIGSVKSNMGHLLTAAGMPGVLKIIFGMSEGIIPPTIHLQDPQTSPNNVVSPQQVITTTTPWPEKIPVRHAGINCFGFGGTNAHIILAQSGQETEESSTSPSPALKEMAIIGMDAHFGPCKGLDNFYLSIFKGTQHFNRLPYKRWKGVDGHKELLQENGFVNGTVPKGAYIENFNLDIQRFRIQPKDADKMQPQQTLILNVADNALKDAGFDQTAAGANVGVIIAMETELAIHQSEGRWDLSWQVKEALKRNNIPLPMSKIEELESICKESVYNTNNENQSPSQFTSFIGNIMAGRISALWDFTGPAFTVSSGESSVFKALELAQLMLSSGEVDAVLVGAVDLAAGFEAILSRNSQNPVNTGTPSLSFNHKTDGWMVGEGAGAVVLKRADKIKKGHHRLYAVIDVISLAQSKISSPELKEFTLTITPETIKEACSQSFKKTKYGVSDTGYLEVSASGIATEDEAEIKGITSAYKHKGNGLHCAIGSIKANIGHTYAAAGIASLIKTALCLHYRFLPGTPNWDRPKMDEVWQGSPFYVPPHSQPWILEGDQSKRVAAISGVGRDNACAHIILSEAPQPQQRQHTFIQSSSEILFPVAGSNPEKLIQSLTILEQSIEKGTSLEAVASKNFTDFKNFPEAKLAVSIVGTNRENLLKEIKAAKNGINKSITNHKPWQTPSGSYFTPTPLGSYAKAAFVYPGSYNAFIGMGDSIFQLFPELYDELEKAVPSVETILFPQSLYPKSLSQTDQEYEVFQKKFNKDTIAMISIDVAFAALFTRILRNIFGFHPQAALGYSIGECSSMLHALGVWDAHNVENTFQKSPLFRDRLVGRMTLLADTWKIPLQDVKKHWTSKIVFAAPDRAKEVVSKHDKLSVTFINSPEEVIISGDRQNCLAAVKDLQCESFDIPIDTVVHHNFVNAEYDNLVRMHNLPVNKTEGIAFYSSLDLKPMNLDREVLASNAARVCCEPVDFIRLVNTVYNDGAKVFIEVGPGSNCARWIEAILKDKPHLAVAMNKKGKSDLNSLILLLAKLVSHRIPIELSPLYRSENHQIMKTKSFEKTVILGGSRIHDTVTSDENKEKFKMVLPKKSTEQVVEQKKETKKVIWDAADLLEFAEGKIANVFGEEYAIIDTYPVRVRLPLPPYLLVSRVTKLLAKTNRFKPSFVQTEYDIPHNAWFTTDKQIPWCVAIESGQCDLLLISYLGIDFYNKGIRAYRLLDCTLTFLGEMPHEGETLRYDISINSFSKSGETLLFFFSYQCYVGERKFLIMEGGCAGFFTQEELAKGGGVIYRQNEIAERKNAKKGFFVPPVTTKKTCFSREDIDYLSNGDLAACFEAESYHPNDRNPSLRLPKGDILMIDRVTSVDLRGGPWGLGKIVAEKNLYEDGWYFPCHFKDDQVLAGSLQAEAAAQLMSFYILYLGMQRMTKDATFQAIPGLKQNVRVRKEIPPCNSKLIFNMEIKEIGFLPRPHIIANCEVIRDGVLLVLFQNLGMQLNEKDPTVTLGHNLSHEFPESNKPVLLSNQQIQEFSLGSLTECFGPEFAIYNERTTSRIPNTDLQLISRIMQTDGTRHVFSGKPSMTTEYDMPSDAWYFIQNSTPIMPYAILMEIALQPCGFFAAYLGSTLQFPEKDLYLRNLDGDGELFEYVDYRGKTLTNKVVLLSNVAMGETVLQKFSFEITCEGKSFYKGGAAFGFFTKEALSSQAGLDEGKRVLPWYKQENIDESELTHIDLTSLEARERFYQSKPDKPTYHLATDQLDLIHQLIIMEKGGRYVNGYVHATKFVKPYDWYLACHFYQDPVMPGSLGVEAIFQAAQAFALHQDLGRNLSTPRFVHLDNHKTIWKYRGQILSHDKEMNLEVHIKNIDKTSNKIVILGDASLWKGDLRIYEVTDLAIVLED